MAKQTVKQAVTKPEPKATMAKQTVKQAVTKPEPKATIPAVMNPLMARMAADAGAGMEGTDRDSFAIPFIRVLQQLSPQCTAGKTGYNPAAKAGMIFNTVTNELIDGEDGIVFIPCAFQRRFIQWGPRGSEGGYKGEWMPEDVASALAGKALVKSDDDGRIYIGEVNPKRSDYLSDTRNHFGLVMTENGPVQALLSLSSSQIKKSKQLMGVLSSIRIGTQTPPTWMNKVRITTVQESNDQGSWYGVRVEHAGFIEDEATYNMGKAFHDVIAEGKGRVDYQEAAAAGSDEDTI